VLHRKEPVGSAETTRDGRLIDDHGHEDVPVVPAEHRTLPAKTSTTAVFALVFGLLALVFAISVVLSPVALILGIVGIVLGVLGLKAVRRAGITGRGVAVSGLVLSVIAVLLVGGIAAGLVTALNNESAVTWMEDRVNDLRDEIPEDIEIDAP
jgi:1,4-dihydroxy-2-naphthoate octaprenyltransferase